MELEHLVVVEVYDYPWQPMIGASHKQLVYLEMQDESQRGFGCLDSKHIEHALCPVSRWDYQTIYTVEAQGS
jgi:hypothetical protein